MVGSVIVYEGMIIGEGWHKKAGEPHAEVNAINAVKDKALLKKATIYVSLEPCSHYGRTPPCCNLIIKNNIPNVVVGTLDPNIMVSGHGIKKLIESGIKVTTGVCEKECLELNKRFFTFHEKKRPYIILKWAESLDGFIAPLQKTEQKPVWITNIYSRQLVHKWRSEEQAILVGTQTVVDDDPKLDVRDWTGHNPLRVVVDPNNRIPRNSNILDNEIKTMLFSNSKMTNELDNIIFENINFEKDAASKIVETLYNHQIQSVIVEGGAKTLQTFINANLWDESRIFIGNIELIAGVIAPYFAKNQNEKILIETDELIISRNYD